MHIVPCIARFFVHTVRKTVVYLSPIGTLAASMWFLEWCTETALCIQCGRDQRIVNTSLPCVCSIDYEICIDLRRECGLRLIFNVSSAFFA